MNHSKGLLSRCLLCKNYFFWDSSLNFGCIRLSHFFENVQTDFLCFFFVVVKGRFKDYSVDFDAVQKCLFLEILHLLGLTKMAKMCLSPSKWKYSLELSLDSFLIFKYWLFNPLYIRCHRRNAESGAQSHPGGYWGRGGGAPHLKSLITAFI